MSRWHQINPDELADQELQPVAQLSLEPDDLAAKTGLGFERCRDDLDEMSVAALAVNGDRFLLRRYAHSPAHGVNVLATPTSKPATQLASLVSSLSLGDPDVSAQWDGTTWREGCTPAA